MSHNKILIVLLLSSAAMHGSSVFSSRGIGLPMNFPNVRNIGMGGAAIAVQDDYEISRVNPAGILAVRFSRFSIQYLYESNWYEDGQHSTHSPYSNFDGFCFAFPVTSRGALSFGLVPHTRMDYKNYAEGLIQDVSYRQTLSGSGGINALNVSGAVLIGNRLSIGMTGRLFLGKIEKDWLIDFEGTDYYATKNAYSTQFTGPGLTLGTRLQVLKNLHVGLIWSPESKLTNKTYRDYQSLDESTKITYIHYKDTLEGSIRLPATLGIGTGWQISKNVFFATDFTYLPWKNYIINGSGSFQTRNTGKISMGAEYISTTNPYAPILGRSAYRLGFSYEPYYLKDPDGSTVHEWWITLGAGIPVWNNSSRANIALAWGKRGSVSENGLTENRMRIILSLDAGEKWFEQRR